MNGYILGFLFVLLGDNLSPRAKIEGLLWKRPVARVEPKRRVSDIVLVQDHSLLREENQSWLSGVFRVLNGAFSPSANHLRLDVLKLKGSEPLKTVFIHFEKNGKGVRSVSLETPNEIILDHEKLEVLKIARSLFSHIVPHYGYNNHFAALSAEISRTNV